MHHNQRILYDETGQPIRICNSLAALKDANSRIRGEGERCGNLRFVPRSCVDDQGSLPGQEQESLLRHCATGTIGCTLGYRHSTDMRLLESRNSHDPNKKGPHQYKNHLAPQLGRSAGLPLNLLAVNVKHSERWPRAYLVYGN